MFIEFYFFLLELFYKINLANLEPTVHDTSVFVVPRICTKTPFSTVSWTFFLKRRRFLTKFGTRLILIEHPVAVKSPSQADTLLYAVNPKYFCLWRNQIQTAILMQTLILLKSPPANLPFCVCCFWLEYDAVEQRLANDSHY